MRGVAGGWGAPFSARRDLFGALDPAMDAPHRPQTTSKGLGLGSEAGQSSVRSGTSVFAPVSGCSRGGARAWQINLNGPKYPFNESTGTYMISVIISEIGDE